jgi:protein-S-isoprenylcysteine O-methyltransferase Ste14
MQVHSNVVRNVTCVRVLCAPPLLILCRTCGENFSHIIADEKEDDHVLIRHGIYAYLRHPSYFGWFYWSVGTQLILCNPICTVLYALAAWYFFSSRIPYEEYMLHDFFGEEYISYCKTTVIGIPFINSNLLLSTVESRSDADTSQVTDDHPKQE